MTAARGVGSTALLSACLGGGALFWAAGLRVLDPREIGWLMNGDWQTHFLGWHFYRHESWHWPPGLIRGLLVPVGTSLGYTDSIPLAALALKPFASWLPNPFQYLGLWLMACFALQALFGALVMATWTPRRSLQVVGAMVFVFLPTLVARIAHPALCAQWLLIWALWLNWRSPVSGRRDAIDHAAIGLTSGLVHPYLSAMTLALLAALAGRRLLERHMSMTRALALFALAGAAVVAGWWTSGLLTLPSASDMTATSGTYSMNLASVVNPGAIPSTFLPGFAAVSASQLGEGYQYLGVGVLFLIVVATVVGINAPSRIGASLPLVLVLLLLTVYSVLPVVAIGRRVLIDVSELGMFTLFRSTGRFFWPVAYTLVAAASGIVAARLRRRTALAILGTALALQMIDMQPWWRQMHLGSRADAFFAWDMPLRSPVWHELLPSYRHIRVYFPSYCRGGGTVGGSLDAGGAALAYLAGVYGLTLNDGFAARMDTEKQARACANLEGDLVRGLLDESTMYVMAPAIAPDFQSRAATADCREIDGLAVCVSGASRATPQSPRLE